MGEKNRTYIFNLLQPIKEPRSSWDRVYDWIVTRAKVVVLFAEILIIIGFVGKVIVDNEAKNKYQEYKTVADNVRFFEQTQEAEFLQIQAMEKDYRELWDKASNFSVIITEIIGYIQNPANKIVISLNKKEAFITGTSSLQDLELLENKMKQSISFISASVNRLALDEQDIIDGVADIDLQATLTDAIITRELLP